MKRKIIVGEIEADRSKLMDVGFEDAIKYLKEMGEKIRLEHVATIHPNEPFISEIWDGYEDNRFAFQFHRHETDEEFIVRKQQHENEQRRIAEAKRIARMTKERELADIEAKAAELRKQLGK